MEWTFCNSLFDLGNDIVHLSYCVPLTFLLLIHILVMAEYHAQIWGDLGNEDVIEMTFAKLDF